MKIDVHATHTVHAVICVSLGDVWGALCSQMFFMSLSLEDFELEKQPVSRGGFGDWFQKRFLH